MAFEVIIPTSAETLVVKWTPDGRALDSGAAIECDLDLIASIGLTVGGQTVAVERLLSEVDLPVVDRGVALAVFTLAGIAAHAAAASVTLPAGLLSDGVETSPAATVTVANRSWAEDDIDALIGDGDLIYYLAKPTEGNDGTATAHTKASVGGTPSQPVGETRFATVEALMAAVRANAPSTTVVRRRAFVLLDQTGTWTTAAGAAFFDLQNTGGESVDAPLTIGTFGDGSSIPKYDAAANKPFVRARRAGSVRVVGPIELDGNLTASNLILITASTSPLDIADIHLDRVWVHHAAGAGVQLLMVNDQIDAENDRVSDVTLRRCVIEDCRGDGLSVSPGGNPPGIWHFVHDYDCLIRRNGSGSGSHNRYTKRVRWSHTRRLLGGTSTGSNMKCDKHRSHLIESSIFIRKGNNFEANGDDLDGARTGREETSPGSVIKALKMRRSTITDLDTDVSQWGIKSNSAIDCNLADECIIDTVGAGPAINMQPKSGGGSGSRYNADGRRSSAAWNLIRVTGSANGCGLRFTVPDTDTPEGPGEPAAEVLANHDTEWTGNILYGVAGAGALIEISNGTLADTVANGRGSLTVAGCCLYHEDGDTKTVREDGVEKSRATAVSDGIIAASNRFENPGCADATRNVERYGREVLGLTGTRLEVLTAIEDVWAEDLIQDGAVRAAYSQEAIHGWMFAGAIPTALTAGNYPLGIPGPDRPVAAGRGLLALTDTDGNPFPSVVVSNAQEGVDGTLSVAVTNVSDTAVTGLAFTAGGVATVTTATPPTTLAARATTTIALSLDAGTVGAAQDWSLTVEADNADTAVLDGELTVTADAAAPDLLLTLVGGPDIGGSTINLGEVIEDTPAPWAVFARNSGNATMNGISIAATGDASLSTETEALPLSLAAGKGSIIRGVLVGAAGTVNGGLSVTYTGGSGSVSFTVASLAEAEPILELRDDQDAPAPASVSLTASRGASPRTVWRIANTGTGTAPGADITLVSTGVAQIVSVVDQGGQAVDRFDLGSYGIAKGGYWEFTIRHPAGNYGQNQPGVFGFTSDYGSDSVSFALGVAEPASANSPRQVFLRAVAPVTDPFDDDWGLQSSGGDGTRANPFGGWAEMAAAVTITDDTVIRVLASDYPLYGSQTFDGVDGVALLGAGGSESEWPRLVNGYPIDLATAHDLTGTFDVYKTAAGALPIAPIRCSRNWNGPVTASGHRKGILESGASVTALKSTENEYFWESGTGTLYVSIPKGEDIADHEVIVSQPDSTVRVNDGADFTAVNLHFQHAHESTGNRYGLKIEGASPRATVANCGADGNRWHNLGTVADNFTGTTFVGCVMRTLDGTGDSNFVLYFETAAPEVPALVRGCTIYLTPWLGPDGLPLATTDRVLGIALHTSDLVTTPATGPVGIFEQCQTIYEGHNPAKYSADISITGWSEFGGKPGDPLDPAAYAVQFRDCQFTGMGLRLGGHRNCDAWVSADRCRFNIQAGSLTDSIGQLGLVGCVSDNSGSGTDYGDNGVLLRSCVISAVRRDSATSLGVVGASGGGTPEIYLLNNTIFLRGTYTNPVYLIAVSATCDKVYARGNIFDGEMTGVRLMTGPCPIANWDFAGNLYASTLFTNFNASVANAGRSNFQSTIDTAGDYATDPDYADGDTVDLEPGATLGVKTNAAQPTGPLGYGRAAYNGRYGAIQNGGADQNPVLSITKPNGTAPDDPTVIKARRGQNLVPTFLVTNSGGGTLDQIGVIGSGRVSPAVAGALDGVELDADESATLAAPILTGAVTASEDGDLIVHSGGGVGQVRFAVTVNPTAAFPRGRGAVRARTAHMTEERP